MDDYEIIDVKFLLDWNKDPSKFKFYFQEFVPRNSIMFMKSMLSFLLAYLISSSFCMFILENTVGFGEDNLYFYRYIVLRYGLIVIAVLSLISVIWTLGEFVFVKPMFRVNKSKVIYITDDEGLYIVNYNVGGHGCTSSCLFPTIIDRIILNKGSKEKLVSKYFKSVTYLDSYLISSSCKDYVVLDIPEDNPIYDDVNDFEILGTTSNFSELRDYLEGNGDI